ncbi:MAG TPA: hypothetical protein VN754_15240 [Candidatus Binataceae bacterium]|nr:hypothetical protein [Candidatus Binataceae bacterium]
MRLSLLARSTSQRLLTYCLTQPRRLIQSLVRKQMGRQADIGADAFRPRQRYGDSQAPCRGRDVTRFAPGVRRQQQNPLPRRIAHRAERRDSDMILRSEAPLDRRASATAAAGVSSGIVSSSIRSWSV